MTSDPDASMAMRHHPLEIDYLGDFDRAVALHGRQPACHSLAHSLEHEPAQAWVYCARGLLFRNDTDSARQLLQFAVTRHHDDVALRFALAGVQKQTRQLVDAERLLREVLVQHPAHAGAGFMLADLLNGQARFAALASTLRGLFAASGHDTEQLIHAVDLLDAAGRQSDAAALCEAQLEAGGDDSRLYACAGMLQIQLGQFDRARASYLHAIAHDARAFEWTVAVGLSSLQRYTDASHPDFALFRDALTRTDLSGKARASLLFALGKAHDDTGDYAAAAGCLAEANALVRGASKWSRKHWQQAVQTRLSTRPWPARPQATTAWAPIFIVGVPRSGTTLVAELLCRYPDVRNRGELAALPLLEQRLERASRADSALLEQVALAYQAQLLQDDAPARWYLDKEPLNLLRIDLILSLFPHARIVVCQRNARDTALSLWSQHFADNANGYAYDLADIGAVIKGCNQLAAHWQKRYPEAMRSIAYEDLAIDADATIGALAAWLGLAHGNVQNASSSQQSPIRTGSLWQARQPVYQRSVDRWKNYAPYLPALLRLPVN